MFVTYTLFAVAMFVFGFSMWGAFTDSIPKNGCNGALTAAMFALLYAAGYAAQAVNDAK